MNAQVVVAAKRRSVPLPQTYAEAKHALAACERLDECKDWADKAAALASYAKQANDKTLEKLALKIRARAIQRSGELLEEIESQQGKRTDLELTTPSDNKSPKQKAAEAAGMSPRQMATAIQVANVPKDEFDAEVESDNPPTVKALAAKGRKKRPPKKEVVVSDHLGGRTPEVYGRAFHFVALVGRFAKELEDEHPVKILPLLLDDERTELGGYLDRAERTIATIREGLSHA